MKVAAAYIRVSDERQDEYSPDSQLRLVREYAKRNGYILPDDFTYYDGGISAKSTKGRDQFNEMIDVALEKDPPFSAIIVWKFSRFSRSEEDSVLLKARLRRNGVSVLSVSEHIDEGNEYGGLIERIIEWDDAHYLRRLSQEVKRGMKEKALRGEPMSRQYGYDLKDKKLYPNADADTVREIFSSYLNGEGLHAIARRLGINGIRTSRGNMPDNRWLEYILRNPVYIGKIRWSENGRAASRRDYDSPDVMVVDGTHEPIIDTKTWDAVQSKFDEQQKKYRRYQRREQPVEYMLKGLLRCSSCGATLTRLSTVCPSVQCHNYSRGSCHTSHCLSIEKANNAVINAMQNAILTMEFNLAPNPNKSIAPLTDCDKLLELASRRLHRAKDAYQAGIDTLDEYKASKEAILNEIAMIEREREVQTAAEQEIDKGEFAKKVMNVLNFIQSNTNDRSKNEALRSIIAHIVYNKQAADLEIYFYS